LAVGYPGEASCLLRSDGWGTTENPTVKWLTFVQARDRLQRQRRP
jgi:hypothetical protein